MKVERFYDAHHVREPYYIIAVVKQYIVKYLASARACAARILLIKLDALRAVYLVRAAL